MGEVAPYNHINRHVNFQEQPSSKIGSMGSNGATMLATLQTTSIQSHASMGKIVPYDHINVHVAFRDHHSSRFGSMGSNGATMLATLQTTSIQAMPPLEKLFLITISICMPIFETTTRPDVAPWAQTVRQCLLHGKTTSIQAMPQSEKLFLMTTSMCMSLLRVTARPDLAPWAQTVQQCFLPYKLHRFMPCLHWERSSLSPYLCACQFWRPPLVQIWLHGLKRCNNACYSANYIDSSHASMGFLGVFFGFLGLGFGKQGLGFMSRG